MTQNTKYLFSVTHYDGDPDLAKREGLSRGAGSCGAALSNRRTL
jgi:hypothetical protein